jgi:hypothetical protein
LGREIFESALGKVLFVDEAYRLHPRRGGPMATEVVDEMVQLLTEPRFKQRLVFILAGYEREVDELLSVNAGLRSRVSERLRFADFTVEEACRILRMLLDRKGLALAPSAEESLGAMMGELIGAPDWGNGRDVETWVKRIFRHFSVRRVQRDNQVGGLLSTGEACSWC